MLWPILFVLLTACGLLVSRLRYKNFQKIHSQLSTNMKYLPIVGHAANFMGTSEDCMKSLQRVGREAVDRGGAVSVWLGNIFFVVIAEPEAAEVVMKSSLDKSDIHFVAKALIGNGSVFAPVPIWRPRRKLISQVFTTKALNSYVKVFTKQSAVLVEKLKLNTVGKGDFSMYEKISKYSLDTICETAFGVEVNSQSNPNHPIQNSFDQYCSLTASRIMKPWLYPEAIYKWSKDFPLSVTSSSFLKQYVAKIVQSKREIMNMEKLGRNNFEYEEDETKMKSFLELLMKAVGDQGFTDLELQEETLVMLLAGNDTTSTVTSFASLLLARYPDVQDKVYQEIKEVIGISDRHIEPNDLPKLKYLEAFIKETMRLYPPGPVLSRMIQKNVTLPSGVTLVPGVRAAIHVWAIHRNPKYWGTDADKFRPERFLENPIKHPYSYLPFSNGLRSCTGIQFAMMSMKTVLIHLIRRLRFVPPSSSGFEKLDELPTKFGLFMKHVDDFKLQIELRN